MFINDISVSIMMNNITARSFSAFANLNTSNKFNDSFRSGRMVYDNDVYVKPQGCDGWKCARLIGICGTVCAFDISSTACMACLGRNYNNCKDCNF